MAYPRCFGLWDGEDTTCMGDSASEDEFERSACGVGTKCRALKEHCAASGESRDLYLRLDTVPGDSSKLLSAVAIDDNRLDSVCAAMSERKQLEPEKVVEVAPLPAPCKWRPGKLAKWREKDYPPEVGEILDHFRRFLLKCLPGARFNVPPKVPMPGEIVEVDKVRRSSYLSYYFKGRRPVPLARVVVTKGKRLVDILLPIDKDSLVASIGEADAEKLSAWPCKSGLFKTVCQRLDMERAAIAAEAIGLAVRSGKINLKCLEEAYS